MPLSELPICISEGCKTPLTTTVINSKGAQAEETRSRDHICFTHFSQIDPSVLLPPFTTKCQHDYDPKTSHYVMSEAVQKSTCKRARAVGSLLAWRLAAWKKAVTVDETAAHERSRQTLASLRWTNATSATEVSAAGLQTEGASAQSTPTLAPEVSVEGDDGPSAAPGPVGRFRPWET